MKDLNLKKIFKSILKRKKKENWKNKGDYIPALSLSKREAKQKVSELFANGGKKATSQRVRDIIDLIENR